MWSGDIKRVLTHLLPGRRWGFLASDLPWSLSSPLPWEAWPSATQGCLKTGGPWGPTAWPFLRMSMINFGCTMGWPIFIAIFWILIQKIPLSLKRRFPKKGAAWASPSPSPGNGVGSFFLVDRAGRRVLLLYGMITMCITMLVGTLEGQLWMALDGVRKKLVP